MPNPKSPIKAPERRHTAGILDIRNIIGALLGVYGVILLLMGIFGDTEGEKTGDVNANLWAGLVLLVVGVVFIAWARLRPVRVPDLPRRTPPNREQSGAVVHRRGHVWFVGAASAERSGRGRPARDPPGPGRDRVALAGARLRPHAGRARVEI